jgi:hypothetical protein
MTLEEGATVYDSMLKLSFRLFNQIDRLRVDNPLLNRPFIVNKKDIQAICIEKTQQARQKMLSKHLPKDKDCAIRFQLTLDDYGKVTVFQGKEKNNVDG